MLEKIPIQDNVFILHPQNHDSKKKARPAGLS